MHNFSNTDVFFIFMYKLTELVKFRCNRNEFYIQSTTFIYCAIRRMLGKLPSRLRLLWLNSSSSTNFLRKSGLWSKWYELLIKHFGRANYILGLSYLVVISSCYGIRLNRFDFISCKKEAWAVQQKARKFVAFRLLKT